MPEVLPARPRDASEVQVCFRVWKLVQWPLLSEAYETGTVIAPAFWMASTAWLPWNLSRAAPTVYGVFSGVIPLPGLLRSALIRTPLPEDRCITTQMSSPGPVLASSRSPKLGAAARSTAVSRTPLPSDEAVAISLPIGPISDAVVSCIQTRVTSPVELTSTRRPAAEESPSESMVWTPSLHFLAPGGSVHR